MHSRNWFCSWEAGRSGSRRRRQRRLWMSPPPSPSQTQAPRTGCSPQQDNHTARCTHRFQAVYAHLEDSGRKADVTLAGGGLPARKRTARPRLTRMWSTWARLRRWTRSFRWGYDERPRHKVWPSFFWVSFVGFFGQFRGGAKEYTKTNDSWFVQRGQAFAAAPLSGSAMK